MTDHRGQGGAQLGHSPLWGTPVNIVDSQHRWCLVFLWSQTPLGLLGLDFPTNQWWQEGVEEKSTPTLGASQAVSGEQPPGLEAAGSRTWLTHAS